MIGSAVVWESRLLSSVAVLVQRTAGIESQVTLIDRFVRLCVLMVPGMQGIQIEQHTHKGDKYAL